MKIPAEQFYYMKPKITHSSHLANMKRWDASSQLWAERADNRGIWRKCHRDPSLVFSHKVLDRLEGVAGKKVCVLGSGDNQAVFALAGLGAEVTSVDLSEKQLEVAAQRAKVLGLEVSFLQADVTDLAAIPDATFDLVYTGGHVAVWVADLDRYYSEAVRVLRTKELFIVDEYHPVRRIWKDSKTELVVEMPYLERGPFRYLLNDDVLYRKQGVYECFEFHWTIADYFNAIIRAGGKILEVDEYGLGAEDWEGAPLKGLPENLLIFAQKEMQT